jgi:hypothetical protein
LNAPQNDNVRKISFMKLTPQAAEKDIYVTFNWYRACAVCCSFTDSAPRPLALRIAGKQDSKSR